MKLNFNQLFRRLLSEEAATTTVEYALLIALILVFCLATLLSTGDVQEALWFQTADRIQIIAQ